MAEMTAYRIYGPRDLRRESMPVPDCGPRDILVRVAATGICGTDIELYDGSMPYIRQGLTKLPLTPGHEWSGTVEHCGVEVDEFTPGDRVVGDISIGCGDCTRCREGEYHLCAHRSEIGVIGRDGGFGEYLVTRARHAYRVPNSIRLEDAALTEPAATAVAAVRKTDVQLGDAVTVLGDGTIGLLCAQAAAASGAAAVLVVSLSEERRGLVESWGFHLANSRDTTLAEVEKELFSGLADVVLEATGDAGALAEAVSAVRPGGRIGALSITGATQLSVDMDYVVTRGITVAGNLASPNAFARTLGLMATGKIDVGPLVTHDFPFEQCNEAFEFLRGERTEPIIKVRVNGSLRE